MYKFLITLLICANNISAQNLPKFENDTLFTKCGFKIYKGQKLKFGIGTREDGRFNYLKIRGSDNPRKLRNKELLVRKVSDFYISGLENAYIKIRGTITDENGVSRNIKFKMIFEKAIGEKPGIEPEIIIPKEFMCKFRLDISSEIEKLFKLYQEGILNKEEYEKQKKKLLEQ